MLFLETVAALSPVRPGDKNTLLQWTVNISTLHWCLCVLWSCIKCCVTHQVLFCCFINSVVTWLNRWVMHSGSVFVWVSDPLPALIHTHAYNWLSHIAELDKSVFSFLRQLTTWHCSQLLLSAGRAAIDRYLLPAWHTAANPPQLLQRSIDKTDRRTDTVPLDSFYRHLEVNHKWTIIMNSMGLAESNGSLPPGLWLTSPAGWLPRTGISSGTLRSVIEYGLPLPFLHMPTLQ